MLRCASEAVAGEYVLSLHTDLILGFIQGHGDAPGPSPNTRLVAPPG
jgi:hypothetical protein